MDSSQVLFQNGKHKGKPLTEVPTGYLRWAADKSYLGEFMIAACRAELEDRARKTLGEEVSLSYSSGSCSELYVHRSKKDEYQAKFDDDPRKEFKIANGFVRVHGTTLSIREIRSIKPVLTPIVKTHYSLTHVAILKEGALGDGPKAMTKVWLTEDEAQRIEEELFR